VRAPAVTMRACDHASVRAYSGFGVELGRLDEKILEVQKMSRYETNEKLNSLVSNGGKAQES